MFEGYPETSRWQEHISAELIVSSDSNSEMYYREPFISAFDTCLPIVLVVLHATDCVMADGGR